MKKESEALKEWIEKNPGKTKRDWLLEDRCDETNRAPMAYLLEQLEKAKVDYAIGNVMTNFLKKYQSEPLSKTDSFYFDVAIAPFPLGRMSTLIEVNMPEEVLGEFTQNEQGERLPEPAYRWLLNQWFPNFQGNFQQAITDMDASEIAKWTHKCGFLNWKSREEVDRYIELIQSMRVEE